MTTARGAILIGCVVATAIGAYVVVGRPSGARVDEFLRRDAPPSAESRSTGVEGPPSLVGIESRPFVESAAPVEPEYPTESPDVSSDGAWDQNLYKNLLYKFVEVAGVRNDDVAMLLDSQSKRTLFVELVQPHVERLWGHNSLVFQAANKVAKRMIAEGRYEVYDGRQERLRSLGGECVIQNYEAATRERKIVRIYGGEDPEVDRLTAQRDELESAAKAVFAQILADARHWR